jgi:hypothetical protein
MTEEQIELYGDLLYRITNDGLDYTLRKYSSWSKIEDSEFHSIRKEYIRIAQRMQEHLDVIRSEHAFTPKKSCDR